MEVARAERGLGDVWRLEPPSGAARLNPSRRPHPLALALHPSLALALGPTPATYPDTRKPSPDLERIQGGWVADSCPAARWEGPWECGATANEAVPTPRSNHAAAACGEHMLVSSR